MIQAYSHVMVRLSPALLLPCGPYIWTSLNLHHSPPFLAGRCDSNVCSPPIPIDTWGHLPSRSALQVCLSSVGCNALPLLPSAPHQGPQLCSLLHNQPTMECQHLSLSLSPKQGQALQKLGQCFSPPFTAMLS